MSKISSNVRRLIRLMDERPQEFKLGDGAYTLRHTPSGVEIWIANGRGFYGPYNDLSSTRDANKFPYWSQFTFHRAMKRWRINSAPDSKFWERLFSESLADEVTP